MPAPSQPHVPRLAVVVALVLLSFAASLVGAPPSDARAPRAILAFLPKGGDDNPDPVLDRLDARPQLAIGLISATQGLYTPNQTLLDISAGSRTSANVYDPRRPPELELVVGGDGTGFIFGWSKVVERAKTALAEIQPGMLASNIPGGAAYAGVESRKNTEAVAAADVHGDVAAVSLGNAADLAERAHRLLIHHLLVVVGLPTAAKGDAALGRLLRDRRSGDVLIVMETPPRAFAPQLLPGGAALPGGGDGVMSSPTTRLQGVVAAIDIPVTILDGLGLKYPDNVKGQPITVEGTRAAATLKTIEARLKVVSGRRTPAIMALLFSWAALTLALGLIADRRGIRAGLRIGGLAMLWVLPMLLLTGWLAPTRLAEIGIIVGGSFVLAALTDRFVRWPRGPVVPALVAVTAYGLDLINGSTLIIRSLLGVNPRSGSRFYGLGNELESTLAVLLMVGLGALLWNRGRSRSSAAIVAVAGAVLSVFVGAAELGADVGGVITVGAGVAAAALLMLPGRLSRRRIALAALVPVAAIVLLALLDLATGGNGHFTRTILHADSGTALWDVVKRRYTLAFNVFTLGAMPLIVVVALLAVAYGLRHRERIYAPLRGSPGWFAAFVGGLTASIAGALFNDSGPLLFVFGVFVLACATAYVRGSPSLDAEGRMP